MAAWESGRARDVPVAHEKMEFKNLDAPGSITVSPVVPEGLHVGLEKPTEIEDTFGQAVISITVPEIS